MKMRAGRAGPGRRCAGVLLRLAADTSELITCVGEGHGGPAYCVNMKRIIDLIRMKEAAALSALSALCLAPNMRHTAPARTEPQEGAE